MLNKALAVILIAAAPFVVSAQSFITAAGGPIPDNNTEVCYDIVVSGLPAVIDSSFGITLTCLDLTHTYDSDIKISLRSPDNSVVVLSNHNGGGGDNYSSTCFSENGVDGWIMFGAPPFTGTWIPEYSINGFNNGMDPNGTWQLCIIDEVPADSGHFNYATLTFGNNPPPDPGLPPGICSTSNASGCSCPDTSITDCDLLPDMTASAMIIQQEHTEYPGYMTVSNATPNIGYGPLEIRGINICYCDTQIVGCNTPQCPDGSYPKQLITQRIYHKNGQVMSYWDHPAGTMTYHPTHLHMHVDDWAIYTLRVATADPIPTHWPIIGDGAKISFCLINLGSCSGSPGYCLDTLGNTVLGQDLPNLGLGSVTGCGNEQGIYVGSLDIYGQGLSGQQIDFPGICNGDYYIVSETDPLNNFLETNDNNNWAAVPVTLTQQGTGPVNPTFNATVNGLAVTFNSVVPGVTSYMYYFGDGDSSNVSNTSHTYAAAGTYTVTLLLFNGTCTATVAQQVTVNTTVGLQDVTFDNLTIQPNPFVTSATVKYTLKQDSQVSIRVYDLKGSLIQEITNSMEHAGLHEYSIEGLAAGTYYLRMVSGSSVVNYRLVRLH